MSTPDLLGLPLEVRTEIFALVLAKDEQLFIDTTNFATEQRKPAIHNHHRNPLHRGQIYCRTARAWIAAPPQPTALLLTNKQIYLEASQVLYNTNKFKFWNPEAAVLFLSSIGAGKHAVRHISFFHDDAFQTSAARPLWLALGTCKGLRSVTLDHSTVCQKEMRGTWKNKERPICFKQLERTARPMFKGLKATFEAQGLVGSAAYVLRFAYTPYGSVLADHSTAMCSKSADCPLYYHTYVMQCGCSCSEVDGIDAEMMAKFRELVMKGIDKRA